MNTPQIFIEIEGGLIRWIGANQEVDIYIRDLDVRDENDKPDVTHRGVDSLTDDEGNEEGWTDEEE